VELVIVRDKASHESKGSAFVWYATRACADRAILQFNLRHLLPDPSGEQDRPLVVRKAKNRTKDVHSVIPDALRQPLRTVNQVCEAGVQGSFLLLIIDAFGGREHSVAGLMERRFQRIYDLLILALGHSAFHG
jgi:RNA recognition motif-containing protein